MSTLKGTTMHPRCRHIGACWDQLEWFQHFRTSQNTSRIQFRTFLKKKIKFFGSHVVVLVKTFPLTYQLLMYDWYWRSQGDFFLGIRKLGVRTEFNFVNFELFENFHISGFPWCSTREDHSIDVSITNVGLILTKLRWFQLFVKSQNSNFELFWKKKKSNFWVSMV